MTTNVAQFARERIIVMAAPNGARRNHQDHKALPMTPGESADDAAALLERGVSVLHLHVRDDEGRHSLDADRYREAIDAIRDKVGDALIIQVTTEAVGRYTSEQQLALVRELRPEAVSLALREVCPVEADENKFSEFAAWMQTENIWPQYILYTVDDVNRFDDMKTRGVLADDAPFTMFVLGKYGSEQSGSVAELERLLAATEPTGFPWAACCFGRNEHEVMLQATNLGGHVRLGFENNLQLPDGSLADDNAELIARYVADSRNSGRTPATAREIRAVFIASS